MVLSLKPHNYQHLKYRQFVGFKIWLRIYLPSWRQPTRYVKGDKTELHPTNVDKFRNEKLHS